MLEERNLEELPAFLNSPYQAVDREIIEFFDVENWSQRFIDYDPEVFSIYEYSGIEAR